MGQLLLFFLCNLCSFFSHGGAVPVTNLFSLLFTDILWLFSKLRSIFYNLLNLQRSSELSQKRFHHIYNIRKSLKQPQSHFHLAVPHKRHYFLLFRYFLCTTTPDISGSSENIDNTALSPDYLSVSFDCDTRHCLWKPFCLHNSCFLKSCSNQL